MTLANTFEERAKEPPRAEVTRRGRWLYAVSIYHGLMQYGPGGGCWYVLGRGRAERKAKRLLRNYIQRKEWDQTPTVIAASQPYVAEGEDGQFIERGERTDLVAPVVHGYHWGHE